MAARIEPIRSAADRRSRAPAGTAPASMPSKARTATTCSARSARCSPTSSRASSDPDAVADRLFVTCEHAGNVVPEEYAPSLRRPRAPAADASRLGSRGAAAGARDGRALRRAALLRRDDAAARRPEPLGRHARSAFGGDAAPVARRERRRLLEAYYFPHRRRVDAALAEAVAGRPPPATGSSTSPRTASRRSCTARSAPPTSACSTTRGRPGEVAFATAWLDALRPRDACAQAAPQLSLPRRQRRRLPGDAAAVSARGATSASSSR